MDFYEAYHFLEKADIFDGKFLKGLDIMVVKVNPATNEWDKNTVLNTKTCIWLEHGPYIGENDCCEWSHDLDFDCGGDTFEEAIIRLAELVKNKYYNDCQYTSVDNKKTDC